MTIRRCIEPGRKTWEEALEKELQRLSFPSPHGDTLPQGNAAEEAFKHCPERFPKGAEEVAFGHIAEFLPSPPPDPESELPRFIRGREALMRTSRGTKGV